MKNKSLCALLFLAAGLVAAGAQERQSEAGFGLQASIFDTVRSSVSDISRNFTEASIYTLTPGDVFTLTLGDGIGSGIDSSTDQKKYEIQLQENYTLDIPIIGIIDVQGKKISDIQKEVSSTLKRSLALQYVNFTLSSPAQFNVFIYGNVQTPGLIVATPMLRVIDAIGMSEGFKSGASYRKIQLSRNGSNLSLDIAKYYSEADMSSNPVLQPGDKIFVPHAETVARIEGYVKYPGSYELIEGESLLTLIHLAGGVVPGGNTESIYITRIHSSGDYSHENVSFDEAAGFYPLHGDKARIASISDHVQRIAIEGAIYGSTIDGESPIQVPTTSVRLDFPYFAGITLLSILDGAGGPTPYALLEECFIEREERSEKIPISVGALWRTRDPSLDLALLPGDHVLIPIQNLQVFVSGMVIRPGGVPFIPGSSVGDYILQVGGIDENRARTDTYFLVDKFGKRTRIGITDIVPSGSHIHVGKRLLFSSDQTVQNILITTAWVTSFITVASTIITFVTNVIVPLFPEPTAQ